jgi:adenylate kinase
MQQPKTKLNAINLKNSLWETLQDLKSGKVQYTDADAIASQAREILRTTNTQIKIAQASNRGLPKEVISFSESE